jgi:hypothetical protein
LSDYVATAGAIEAPTHRSIARTAAAERRWWVIDAGKVRILGKEPHFAAVGVDHFLEYRIGVQSLGLDTRGEKRQQKEAGEAHWILH